MAIWYCHAKRGALWVDGICVHKQFFQRLCTNTLALKAAINHQIIKAQLMPHCKRSMLSKTFINDQVANG